MPRRSDIENASSLARVACTLALRKSLRQHAPVFRGEPFTLALLIPEEARKDFERAFHDLKKAETVLANVDLGLATTSLRGRHDYTDIKASLRANERVVIFLEKEDGIPAYVVAAADTIKPVHPIDAAVLAEAVKTVHEVVLDPIIAERMIAFPLEDVLAALRPGRSHSDTLRRLGVARQSTLDKKTPPVEQLAGYGAAGEWARVIVSELADWRDGKLPWEELDSGALLSGPPGVGKTLFARSLARSCDCSFVASSIAQWQSAGHLGDMLKAMRATFKLAAERAPTILLLDEFDSVGDRARFTGDNAQYCTEVVAALLECLDGAYRREGVVVVGACNHPARIDPALLRPGRLGRHFPLSLPDIAARKGILATHLGASLSANHVDRVLAATEGFSGAELAQLAKDARRRARTRAGEVTVDDVLASLPAVKPIEGVLRDRICVHEAGHVAAGLALDVGRLAGAVVMDRFRGGVGVGGGAYFEREDRLTTSEFYMNNLVTQLAGMAAEFVFFGDHLDGSGGGPGSDLQRAADLATTMVAQLGMGGTTNFLSAGSFEDLDRIRRTVRSVNQRVETMLAEQYERAKEIVIRNSPFICELAAILNKEGSVDGDRATTLFRAQRKSDAA